jgi:carbonic anhydrase
MKRMLSAAALVLLLAGTAAASQEQAHWSYAGKTGPEHWAELNPAYSLCAKGANQSPVNLTGCLEAELEPLTFDYNGLAIRIKNNGHTIQADYAAGSTLTVNGKTYQLKQFHFHAPSEHQVKGEHFPLEGHFVHADKDGHLLVLAVLYDYGKENPELKKLWQQMPKKAGQEEGMASRVRAEGLLPEKRDYLRLNGSLTTPPCTEGVLWLIMRNPVMVSKEQVKQFTAVMGGPNNRPVQPLNARALLR